MIHLRLGPDPSISSSVLFPIPHFVYQLSTTSDHSDLISVNPTRQMDPIPTAQACLPSLLPLITAIIHSSLTRGIVPSPFKTAAITPKLKNPGEVPSNFNNLHPISTLPFLSKILQEIVATQLHSHLSIKIKILIIIIITASFLSASCPANYTAGYCGLYFCNFVHSPHP